MGTGCAVSESRSPELDADISASGAAAVDYSQRDVGQVRHTIQLPGDVSFVLSCKTTLDFCNQGKDVGNAVITSTQFGRRRAEYGFVFDDYGRRFAFS